MKDITLPFTGDHIAIFLLMLVNWILEIGLLYLTTFGILGISGVITDRMAAGILAFIVGLIFLIIKNIFVNNLICDDNRCYQSGDKMKLHNSRMRYMAHYYLFVIECKKLPTRLHLPKVYLKK